MIKSMYIGKCDITKFSVLWFGKKDYTLEGLFTLFSIQ